MSMPSSSAFVETTARTEPSRSPFSISRLLQRKVAAPVAANTLWRPRRIFEIVLQIRRQDLGGQAALREHDQLQVAFEEFRGNAPRFAQIGASNAQLMIDDRRIHEHEELLAARRAASLDELERLFGEPFGELASGWQSSPTNTETSGSIRSAGRYGEAA